MRIPFLFSVILLQSCSSTTVLKKHANITTKKSTNISTKTYYATGSDEDKRVDASLTLRAYSSSDIKPNLSHWYGTDEDSPELVISDISVAIDCNKVIIPPIAYNRHSDFIVQGTPFHILKEKDTIILRFGGSDNAGAYYLDIHIKDRKFIEANTFTYNSISGNFELDNQYLQNKAQ